MCMPVARTFRKTGDRNAVDRGALQETYLRIHISLSLWRRNRVREIGEVKRRPDKTLTSDPLPGEGEEERSDITKKFV